MVTDPRFFPFIFVPACRAARGKAIVYKFHSMADKTKFSDGYQFTDKTVRLNFGSPSYQYTFLDFSKRADKTIIRHPASIKINRFNQFYIGSECDIHDPGFQNGWLIQWPDLL